MHLHIWVHLLCSQGLGPCPLPSRTASTSIESNTQGVYSGVRKVDDICFCQISHSNVLKYSPILCHPHRYQDGRGVASKEVVILEQVGKRKFSCNIRRGAGKKNSTTEQSDELKKLQVAKVANSLVDMRASKASARKHTKSELVGSLEGRHQPSNTAIGCKKKDGRESIKTGSGVERGSRGCTENEDSCRQ